MGVQHKCAASICILLSFFIQALVLVLASLGAALYIFSIPFYLYAATTMLHKDLGMQRVVENARRKINLKKYM